MALARSVLPQPGSPMRSTPRGMRLLAEFHKPLGVLEELDDFGHLVPASSMPATSLNVTETLSLFSVR